MIGDGLKLSVYFGESMTAGVTLSADALMNCFGRHELAAAVLLRGVEGYGASRRIQAGRFPDLSTDLPLLAMALDTRERIHDVIDDVDEMVPRGLVTLEHVVLATGEDAASARVPDGPGAAARLTLFVRPDERVGGRPADRAATEILRRHGAACAVALAGADGVLGGRRSRVRLLSVRNPPVTAVVSVGPRELLARCVAPLARAVAQPVIALEAVAQLKHDGQLLERPPVVPPSRSVSPDLWQAISVYTRRSARADGRALYSELTRRLREAGGAGATTVLGEWGFSGDERPYGDRLGRIASHRPSCTVYVDRPEKVTRAWPLIDEVTAEYGVVTSSLVPGYRERTSQASHGSLDAPERAALPADPTQRLDEPVVERPSDRGWTAALVARARDFALRRGGHPPVVRVTLTDGERFFLLDVEPGPEDELVTLYPHPERYADLLRGPDDVPIAPRAVLVAERAIAKVELLSRAPRGTPSSGTFRSQ